MVMQSMKSRTHCRYDEVSMMCIRTATTSKYPKKDKVRSEGGKLKWQTPTLDKINKGCACASLLSLRFFPLCRLARDGDGVSGGLVVADVIPGVEACP
jgi:hypothetical protein